MRDTFHRFGGLSAILVGVLSILYAISFLVITRRVEFIGNLASWLLLGLSGIFSSAAYVALYQRVRPTSEGYALWALLLGTAASFATLLHGGYQVLTVLRLGEAAAAGEQGALALLRRLPSQVDPAGLAAFFVVGLVAFIFSLLMLRGGTLPRALGYLGVLNALLLVGLYFASSAQAGRLIPILGGLTAIVVGPSWWIWLGVQLMAEPGAAPGAAARHSHTA